MKKLLGSTLALGLLFPAVANAELLKNLKLSGDLEVDATQLNNGTDFSKTPYEDVGAVQTRLMLSADWDVLDDVHGRVTLVKNDRTWGSAPQAVGGTAGSIEANVIAQEAFVKIDNLFGSVALKAGRQYYGEAGDNVIYFGPRNDFGLTVTAIDGANFVWSGDKLSANVLLGTITGTGLATNTGSASVMGVNVTAKPSDNLSGSAFFYDKNTVNSGSAGAGTGTTADDILYVAGVKAKATMGGAWVKGEIDKDFGQNRPATNTKDSNYDGWAAIVNAGDKVDTGMGAVTGWGTAEVGSGGVRGSQTFQGIAGDNRPGGIAGRFWSGAGGSTDLGSGGGAISGPVDNGGSIGDRVDVGVGAKVTPSAANKLTVGVSAWNYRVQQAQTLNAAANGNKMLGTEGDIDLNWQHNENVSADAGVGRFWPGGAYGNSQTGTAGLNSANLAYADIHIKFGGSSN